MHPDDMRHAPTETASIKQPGEIPLQINALEKSLHSIDEAVTVLGATIMPALSSERPMKDAPDNRAQLGCEIATKLQSLSEYAATIARNVNALTERVEL